MSKHRVCPQGRIWEWDAFITGSPPDIPGGVRKLWIQLYSSLWFVPSLMVLGAMVLAFGLVEWDIARGDQLPAESLRPFLSSSPEGARGMLTSIASSMITVAGVAFSVTIVTLSLASSQYTPRIMRNFMKDRGNQLVLGAFVGIYVYCLGVLRTIRSESERAGEFVPLMAVSFGIVLALVGIGFLIYFIHHVSASIQASSILKRISEETLSVIEKLYPDKLHEQPRASGDEDDWHPVATPENGYLQCIDDEALHRCAEAGQLRLRLELTPGDFAISGAPLLRSDRPISDKIARKITACFAIDDFRTIEQDAGFGIRQLVDIALKALSPGINDTSTAVSCLDYLSVILGALADRHLVSPSFVDKPANRITARPVSFEHLLAKSLDEIRLSALNNVAILLQMFCLLSRVAAVTFDPKRRAALYHQFQVIRATANHHVREPYDRHRINQEIARLKTWFPDASFLMTSE